MPARLLVYSGSLKGKALALPPEGKVILGRSQHAHITIPDTNLSRSHCAIAASGKGYLLEDMNSTNGTTVNGKPARQVVLREGDRIVLGETEMEFRVKAVAGKAEPKMDLVPVGEPEPVSGGYAPVTLNAKLSPQAPDAPGGTTTERLKRARFCDVCDASVSRPDLDSGAAREIAGRLVCRECVGRLEGRNIDAVGSVEAVLDELASEIRRKAGRG